MEAQDRSSQEEPNEFSLEEIRKLIDDKNNSISDEELKRVMQAVSVFCKVAYELYSEQSLTIGNQDHFKELKQAA